METKKDDFDGVMVDGVKVPQFYDGDSIVIAEECGALIHKCCGCGLWHRMDITTENERDGDIYLTVNSIDGEPDFTEFESVSTKKL